MSLPPTERFSSRAGNYVKYRPSYPASVIGLLALECGLKPGVPTADVGSGTGILTKLLLDAGAEVYAIEPNGPMRAEAEASLAGRARFHSISATAESTTLPDSVVDIVTAAQAFHWFDRAAARAEFARILRPGGSVALIWNDRLVDRSPFSREYEHALLSHAPEYAETDHRGRQDDAIREFFEPAPFRTRSFDNSQRLDADAFVGRAFSSSYAPEEGAPGYEALKNELIAMFERHASGGVVEFQFKTRVYWGRIG